jgi:hypothetical protein
MSSLSLSDLLACPPTASSFWLENVALAIERTPEPDVACQSFVGTLIKNLPGASSDFRAMCWDVALGCLPCMKTKSWFPDLSPPLLDELLRTVKVGEVLSRVSRLGALNELPAERQQRSSLFFKLVAEKNVKWWHVSKLMELGFSPGKFADYEVPLLSWIDQRQDWIDDIIKERSPQSEPSFWSNLVTEALRNQYKLAISLNLLTRFPFLLSEKNINGSTPKQTIQAFSEKFVLNCDPLTVTALRCLCDNLALEAGVASAPLLPSKRL